MQSPRAGQTSEAEADIQKRYAEKFLSSLNWLRSWDLMCDLTLKVGGESFPAHSPVLAAASKYFFELLKTKDSGTKKKVIEFKDASAHVVRQCVEFMYTGGTVITMENVFNILSASEVFKLEELAQLCLEFLSDNISVENSVKVKGIFEKYGYDKKSDTLDTPRKSRHAVVTSGFLKQDKKIFEAYLKSIQLDPESVWDAIKNWVAFDEGDRKRFFFELVSLMSDCFPAAFILDTIWEDNLTKESQRTKELIGNILLDDIDSFKEMLTSANCFVAKRLCEAIRHPNSIEAHAEVRLFMIKNFDDVWDNDDITTISKDEIFQIFRSPKTKYPSETVKWNVALTWVKFDLSLRKVHFPHLLSCIKLHNMPLGFLQGEVRSEELVQQFDECKEMLMDALFAVANPSEPTVPPTTVSPNTSPSKRERKRNTDELTPISAFSPERSPLKTSSLLAPINRSGILIRSPNSSPGKQGRRKKADAVDTLTMSASSSLLDNLPTANATPRQLRSVGLKTGSKIAEESPKASPAKRGRKNRIETENISSPAAKRRKQDSNVGNIECHEAVVSSTEKPYLAVFDPLTGRVKGLDLLHVQWDVLAVSKVAKDAYQGIVCSQKKMYLLKGKNLFTFDATKKSWDALPSKQRKPVACSQMVVWEGNIYVLQDGHYDVFNIAEEMWIEQKRFISLGVGFCACVLRDDIYAVGGESRPKSGMKYNMLTESISDIEPMKLGRIHAAAVSLNNKVYVLGGTINQEFGSSVESYDFVTDTWTTMMNMQMKRSHLSVCAHNGNIYAVGGGIPHTGTMDTVEVYETGTKNVSKWRIFHRMLRMSNSASACILDIQHDS